MRLYISGPMTGWPDLNTPAFRAAARALVASGYEVCDPSALNAPGILPEGCMLTDLRELLRCGGVATLPDCASSRGARLEIEVANACGLPVAPVLAWQGRAAPVLHASWCGYEAQGGEPSDHDGSRSDACTCGAEVPE